jgi:hypothetical protein
MLQKNQLSKKPATERRIPGTPTFFLASIALVVFTGVAFLSAKMMFGEKRVAVRCSGTGARMCDVSKATGSFGTMRTVGSFSLNKVKGVRSGKSSVKNPYKGKDSKQPDVFYFADSGVMVRGRADGFKHSTYDGFKKEMESRCGACADDIKVPEDESYIAFCDDCSVSIDEAYGEMNAMALAIVKASKGRGAFSMSASNTPQWFFGPLTIVVGLAGVAAVVQGLRMWMRALNKTTLLGVS